MPQQLEPRINWLLRDFGHLIQPSKRPSKPQDHTGMCEYSVVPKGHPAFHIGQWDSQYCQICGLYDLSLIGF